VRSNWIGLLGTKILNPMDSLVKNIKILKTLVINWERKKKREAKDELVNIEIELDTLYSNFPRDFEKEEDKVLILEKEKRKLVILRHEEETWRQKSRLNWLASRDKNTKFFHAYANSIKNNNTIWDITKEDGTMIASNQGLQKEAVGDFRNIFKAQANLSISDQLAVLRNYPRMFSEEEGLRLDDQITLAEILSTLKGFIASKSLGPDGWTIEFFLAFFNLLGNELLEAIEESRRKGRVSGALNETFLYLISKIDKP